MTEKKVNQHEAGSERRVLEHGDLTSHSHESFQGGRLHEGSRKPVTDQTSYTSSDSSKEQ